MSVAPPRPAAVRPLATAPALQPVLGARRPRGRLAAAGLLVVIFALGNVVLYSRLAAGREVLALARDVHYGEILGPGDVKVVQLRTEGVAAIPAARSGEVVGHTVRATLPRGALLAPSVVLPGPPVGPGEAVASVALRLGLYPTGLRPGDHVQVVRRAAAGALDARGAAAEVIATATVLSVQAARDAGGATAVSLVVPKAIAAEVSAAGAEGRVTLVLVGGP